MAGRLFALLCLIVPLLNSTYAAPTPQSTPQSTPQRSVASTGGTTQPVGTTGAGAQVATTDASTATTGGSSACSSGRTYTVVPDDTCEKISLKRQTLAATRSLILLNNIPPDCKNLQIGQQLCLPKPCRPYVVKPKQTCAYIAGKLKISVAQFRSYNP